MNAYVSLVPETLEIVDRFRGTRSDVESRSSDLEHVIVPPEMNSDFVIPGRNSETNEIEFTVDTEAVEVETQNRIQSRWIMFRGERRQRLSECDWVVSVSDSPLPQEKIDEWKVYRQALRDLPSVTEDPANPVWPSIPTA